MAPPGNSGVPASMLVFTTHRSGAGTSRGLGGSHKSAGFQACLQVDCRLFCLGFVRLKLQSRQIRYLSIDTFSAPHATLIREFLRFVEQVFLQDP